MISLWSGANLNCLNYSQNLVMTPRGSHCQEGLTDWPTVNCKVTQT